MEDEIIIRKGDDGRIIVSIPYNIYYISKMKNIKGYRYNSNTRAWSIPKMIIL